MPSSRVGNYRITKKGYGRINGGKYRGWYLHRAVFAEAAGRKPLEGFHIHHQPPFNKLCQCPHMLIEIDPALHIAQEPPRCAYTGRYFTKRELDNLGWRRQRESEDQVPF